MSFNQMKLCSSILKQDFGEMVEKVALFLLKKGFAPLRVITHETKLQMRQVRKALVALIQHRIVNFEESPKHKGVVEYTANVDKVLVRPRFSRYIYTVKTLYGDAAELIVEEILHHGQMSMSEVIQKVTNRLNEALEGTAQEKVTLYQVRDKFVNLVQTQFMHRCIPVESQIDAEAALPVAPLFVDVEEETLFQVPPLDVGALERRKRKRSVDDSVQPAKRLKSDDGGENAPSDDGIYWHVNFERFDRHLRDQTIIAAVVRKVDMRAGEIMRTFLRLSEIQSDVRAPATNPLSNNEVFQALPEELGLSRQTLDQYLKILVDDSTEFLVKMGDSGGGMYSVNFRKFFTSLCRAHIESVVQERYGSKSLRVYRLLLLKKQLEQKQIEEFAMISAKEVKELLYKMFGEQFISLTEVTRTPDHLPARTFYLFSVNVNQVSRMLLDRSLRAMYNLMSRRDHEGKENKRLLEKQQRVEAIITSLEQSGADGAQREEVEEMITPAERAQLAKVKHMTTKLEKGELALDDTIYPIQMYLHYVHAV